MQGEPPTVVSENPPYRGGYLVYIILIIGIKKIPYSTTERRLHKYYVLFLKLTSKIRLFKALKIVC